MWYNHCDQCTYSAFSSSPKLFPVKSQLSAPSLGTYWFALYFGRWDLSSVVFHVNGIILYVIFVPDVFSYTVCEICCLSLLLLSSVPLYGYMQFFNPFTCWWSFGLFIVFGSFQGLQTKWPSTCFCKKSLFYWKAAMPNPFTLFAAALRPQWQRWVVMTDQPHGPQSLVRY